MQFKFNLLIHLFEFFLFNSWISLVKLNMKSKFVQIKTDFCISHTVGENILATIKGTL